MASAALTSAYVTCLCPERAVKGSMQSVYGSSLWRCDFECVELQKDGLSFLSSV